MKILLRTFVSPVFVGGDMGLAAMEPLEFRKGHPVCWLDSLLGGGIQIPEGVTHREERPLLWLISGPHGSGKTTLAMELTYRLASEPQPEKEPDKKKPEKPRTTGKKVRTILYSRESSKGRIRENMESFGWDLDAKSGMQIVGSTELAERGDAPETMFKEAVAGFEPSDDFEGSVAILDGLGAYLSDQDLEKLVDQLLTLLSGKVWLVVLVLDLPGREFPSRRLADRADILTEFREGLKEDYRLRTMRVAKMRFQEHVQGDHIVKIYGKPLSKIKLTDPRMPASDHIGLDRKEGGIFILPSIHRHLSGGIRHAGRLDLAVEAPVTALAEILPMGTGNVKGFPQGRCTAFVGDRGGLKSYLAYFTLLNHLAHDPSALGILLSLRDDQEGAINSLETICRIENTTFGRRGVTDLTTGKQRRLHVEFFWPGYIPPSEFMHRVVVATEGMLHFNKERKGEDLVVVLNGLDHLNARHPLCAKEEMFVPALISYFRQHCSSIIVVAATDGETSPGLTGLEPMADCLLRFQFAEAIPAGIRDVGDQFINVRAQRVPAGGIGGGQGTLYRAKKEKDGKKAGHLEFWRTFPQFVELAVG